jgi:hypothetical protein
VLKTKKGKTPRVEIPGLSDRRSWCLIHTTAGAQQNTVSCLNLLCVTDG